MRKSLLSSVFELVGFAAVGLLFFVWLLGHKKNNILSGPQSENITAQASVGMDEAPERRTIFDEPIKVTERTKRSKYKGSNSSNEPIEVYEAAVTPPRPSVKRERRSSSSASVAVRRASAVRSWKGVHRDEQFSWDAYTRYAEEVAILSKEYGLYPEVFMARIIAYSYDFIEHPGQTPADNNMTAMRSPKTKDRAMFRSASESLKAYAVVNAGEIKKLSADGAIAKFDRAWTVRKIIQKYSFISDLGKEVRKREDYAGLMGSASRISEEEVYNYELEGEAINMVSSVEEKVRKNRAAEQGFDSWEDYLEDLSPAEQAAAEQDAADETSAVSKKKSYNLSRRVDAKQLKRKQ